MGVVMDQSPCPKVAYDLLQSCLCVHSGSPLCWEHALGLAAEHDSQVQAGPSDKQCTCNRSGGWDSLEESSSNQPDEEQQRRGPNPLLERHVSHVCLPVIDTRIMLVDSIKARSPSKLSSCLSE